MTLVEKLRMIRLSQRMTLRDVSSKTGIAISWLSRMERGLTDLSIPTTHKLITAYGITLREVLTGTEYDDKSLDAELPSSLVEFFDDANYQAELDSDWKQLLSSLHYQGRFPQYKRDWIELYLHIRHVLVGKEV